MEVPPKKYYRLSPGTEVRLRYSYLIRCEEVVKDAEGNITELRCTYDPESGNGSSSDGRRVKGVIHWVSAADAIEAEIRLFNPLFTTEDPDDVAEGGSWEDNLNPDSMIVTRGYLEPSLGEAPIGQPFQFERVGYFCADTDSKPGHPVFNRTVTLKDSWAKIFNIRRKLHIGHSRKISDALSLLYSGVKYILHFKIQRGSNFLHTPIDTFGPIVLMRRFQHKALLLIELINQLRSSDGYLADTIN